MNKSMDKSMKEGVGKELLMFVCCILMFLTFIFYWSETLSDRYAKSYAERVEIEHNHKKDILILEAKLKCNTKD